MFHLCIVPCRAIAGICYLFGPFHHVATSDFHIPHSGLGFQAAGACKLATLTKTKCLEI